MQKLLLNLNANLNNHFLNGLNFNNNFFNINNI
ncbi:hypothetical protein SRH_01460 [Mesomycoplasma hyorhinis MCLD]|uniref:Uncharacterized protein n=1 Tax=Mesomycoplasma hyorhinis (strain MCLD) TaxID=936139 RepID=A0ABM5M588_MESHM|nr:hypothetical protein SRH_01460 [Mesomycoplasma hyorhinis MCLD]